MAGTVRDITLRHTVIQNFENQMIVVPNSVINKEKLVNYNSVDKRICVRLEIGISYDSDIDLARKIMQEEAEQHPLLIEKRTLKEIKEKVPKVPVKVVQITDFSVVLRIYAWTANPDNGWDLRYDLLESIKKRFDKEGVEIPFPHQSIYFKNPLKKEE